MLSVLKQHSILYVEDEPEIQANIQEYLESYFQTVYLASEGRSALELYKQYHPDILLLDINIPYIDGLSLAKQIRKSNKKVKIVMLTGHTETEKLLKATELKLTKYLIKPLSPRKFKETLELLAKELIENPSEFIHLNHTTQWHKLEKKLYREDKAIVLLEKEQRLLELFITKKSKIVSYADIMLAVWEDSFDREISLDSVKNQVSHLRKKLPKNIISTVYGQGYLLN